MEEKEVSKDEREYKTPDFSGNSRPASSLKAREIYSLINKVTKIPPEQVQDVFQAYSLIVEFCLTQGIDLPMPYIGNFQCGIKKGHKAGETYLARAKGSSMWYRGEDGKPCCDIAKENIYRTLDEDQPDYIAPYFRFLKKLKKEVKEQTSKQWITGEPTKFQDVLMNLARPQEKGVSKPKPNCHKKKEKDGSK